jgi:RNA polymerase sigma-70 factor (ECF subfamily)
LASEIHEGGRNIEQIGHFCDLRHTKWLECSNERRKKNHLFCNKNDSPAYIQVQMSRIFQQWVTQYQNDVWSLARYLLGDPAEAEDAAQEVFVRLWKHRDSIERERVRPWIMKVTRNECLDRLRRRRPQQELDESLTAAGGPLDDLQQAEISAWLQRAIGQLQEPFRSLVLLRDVRQHSYEDVALTMDMSMSQVKVYLHRARKRLREQLMEMQA